MVNGKFYLIGGQVHLSESSFYFTPTVEMDDPNTNLWTYKKPLPDSFNIVRAIG